MGDLFEAIWKELGCTYMSDISFSPYRERAIALAKSIPLSRYDDAQITELCRYLGITREALENRTNQEQDEA